MRCWEREKCRVFWCIVRNEIEESVLCGEEQNPPPDGYILIGFSGAEKLCVTLFTIIFGSLSLSGRLWIQLGTERDMKNKLCCFQVTKQTNNFPDFVTYLFGIITSFSDQIIFFFTRSSHRLFYFWNDQFGDSGDYLRFSISQFCLNIPGHSKFKTSYLFHSKTPKLSKQVNKKRCFSIL